MLFTVKYGWVHYCSSLSDKLLKVAALGPHTCLKTRTPLINCIVNDALFQAVPNVQQAALPQLVDGVHARLVDTLLNDAPYLVVHRVEVRAIRWPEVRGDECRRCLLEKSNSVTCSMCGSIQRIFNMNWKLKQ